MDNAEKYRICEILGVDLEEEFKYQMAAGSGTSLMTLRLRYREGEEPLLGCVVLETPCSGFVDSWIDVNKMYSSGFLIDILNHPERIIRKRVWTERDIADAKAVKRLFSWATTVKRSDFNNELTIEGEYVGDAGAGHCTISLDRTAFPSVKPGEDISLAAILEDENGL